MGSRDLAGCTTTTTTTTTMQISTITTLFSLLITPCITSPLQRSSHISSSLQRRFSRPAASWGLSNLEDGADTSLHLLPLSISAQELGLAGLRNRQLSVISSLDVLRQQLLQEIQRGGRGRSSTTNNQNNNLGRNNNNNSNNNNNLERIG